MALFKSRKGGDDPPAAPAPAESVEAARKRARHRLIGAALLVLAGVIGFPLLFDTQPRPVAVDIPIEIPDKNKARPVAIVAAPAVPATAQSAADAPVAKAAPAVAPKPPEKAPKVADAPAKQAEPKETVVAAKSADKLIDKAAEKAAEKAADKATDKAAVSATKPSADAGSKATNPDAKPAVKPSDAAKAQALLDGSNGDKPPAVESRFVVQVGAFADAALAKEARAKLERAGLKTYTTVVETKEGQRTRVRVGPFADKTDADTAASKIKALDLPAAILVL
jgi:DedD protein